jgi:hypothetical protein
MKPWITHNVGCGPSSWRQCWACTTLLRVKPPHWSRSAGLTAWKLLSNRMLCTLPLASHSAIGLAGREATRGIAVGAGKDNAGSFAAASSA